MNVALIDAPESTAESSRRAASRPVSTATVAATIIPVRTPWWLSFHLLSLDAPLVAVVWQRWWARSTGIALPLSREIVLGLGVWAIYLADRLADTAHDEYRLGGAARHVFSGDRRHLLWPLALGVALILAVLTPLCLSGGEFHAGLGLLALASGYFWLVHGQTSRGWSAYLPKEAVVGAMFGAGTVFFVVCRAHSLPPAFWMNAGLFAAVCFLNCALITHWERHAWDVRERSSLLNSFPGLSARLGLASVALAGLAFAVCAGSRSLDGLPVAVSALLLAGLDFHKTKLSVDALRVLADVVLLTPWLILAWNAFPV